MRLFQFSDAYTHSGNNMNKIVYIDIFKLDYVSLNNAASSSQVLQK